MDEQRIEHRQLAIRISAMTNDEEKAALHQWAIGLLEIRNTALSNSEKAQKAVLLTKNSKVILPIVKLLGRETKRFAWKDRNWAGRMGLGGAAVGMAVFGTHAAGLAAFGTAVGVPLWVVLGSGGAFAGVLIEQLGAFKNSSLDSSMF